MGTINLTNLLHNVYEQSDLNILEPLAKYIYGYDQPDKPPTQRLWAVRLEHSRTIGKVYIWVRSIWQTSYTTSM